MREMRRKDREVTAKEAMRILKEGEYGVLSTVSKNGKPYGVPLSYCVIDDTLFFHSALKGKKLDNIIENRIASFCVVGKTEVLPDKFSTKYESIIVDGNIEESFGKEKQLGLEGLIEKYSINFQDEGLAYIKNAFDMTTVLKLTINNLSGKARK